MRPRLKAAMCVFVPLLLMTGLGWATANETTLAGRTVTMDLVKADDRSPAPWPDDHGELVTDRITIPANANIYDLLTANGIEPDVEAFTVVYDLNPLLKVIDPLPSGVNLLLPKMTGGDKLQQQLRGGYLVQLTVDRTLREELARSTSDLQNLSARFANLPPDRFAIVSIRESMAADIKALTVWFAYIQKTFRQRTGPPLRRQTLLGIHDEALALNSVLAAIAGGQEKVTPTDQEQVNAIYKDIQVQMKKYDNIMAGEPPAGEERYEIVVTIRNDDRLKDPPQVYYAYEGLFRKPPHEPLMMRPFEKAASGFLTFGDYVIWVGKPDHPFPPLTDQKPISIPARDKNVVLTVIQ